MQADVEAAKGRFYMELLMVLGYEAAGLVKDHFVAEGCSAIRTRGMLVTVGEGAYESSARSSRHAFSGA